MTKIATGLSREYLKSKTGEKEFSFATRSYAAAG